MRVAFDATVSCRVTTGVGVYARQLFPALVNRGLDIRLWQQPIGTPGGRLRVWNGVRLATWEAVGVPRRAQRERIGVVHSTAVFGPLRAGCPLLMTLHDAMAVTMPMLPNAAEAVAEHFRIPRARIRAVPLGVAQTFRQRWRASPATRLSPRASACRASSQRQLRLAANGAADRRRVSGAHGGHR